jgi:hypothetical protein
LLISNSATEKKGGMSFDHHVAAFSHKEQAFVAHLPDFLICTLFLSLSPKIRLYKGIGHRNPPYLGFLSDGFCFQ